MPTPILKNISHFQTLFNQQPDYKFLRVFGCACWPNLRPFNRHKMDMRSQLCVFLGYSLNHKGYNCLHIPTGRIYVSRDVRFDENSFPFSDSISPLNSSTISSPSTHTHNHSFGLPPSPDPFNSNTHSLPNSSLLSPRSSSAHSLIPPSVHSSPIPSAHSNPTSLTRSNTHLPHLPSSPNPTSSSVSSSPVSISPQVSLPPASASSTPTISPSSNPTNTHPMLTSSKTHHSRPLHRTDGTLSWPLPKVSASLTESKPIPEEPTSYTVASQYSVWRDAMASEFEALLRNHTWDLVPPSSNINILGSKWVLKTKRHADGTLERRKARLVAKGFHQQLLGNGLFIYWMCRTRSYMGTSKKMFSCISRLGL
ncbi:hypothetical protein F2P56_015962 [Juglans regia]|uniref:Retroviral polymerase SH3-like domain-containing protein n=1 Tax=Juglans regia TaxID=51240 RepID=A0A833XG48_JUGRE|nr:hypothetical protein F2P56_015962 [Juglans regia]